MSFEAVFISGSHGNLQNNRIHHTNIGILTCNWFFPVPGELGFYPELVPNNSGNYWNIHSNEITDAIQIPGIYASAGFPDLLYPAWGILMIDGANHNLIQGNRISGVMADTVLLGSLNPSSEPAGLVFPPSHENVVIAGPNGVVESYGDDPEPTFGNLIMGSNPLNAQERTLYKDVRLNAGSGCQGSAAPPLQPVNESVAYEKACPGRASRREPSKIKGSWPT